MFEKIGAAALECESKLGRGLGILIGRSSARIHDAGLTGRTSARERGGNEVWSTRFRTIQAVAERNLVWSVVLSWEGA